MRLLTITKGIEHRLLSLFLLIFLASCGKSYDCDSPDFHTAGLDVCAKGLSVVPEHVELAVQFVEQRTQEVYPEVVETAKKYNNKGVLVVFLDSDLSVECEEIENGIYKCKQHIGGANTNWGRKMFVKYHKCLAFTSLPHELLHSIEEFYLGGYSKDHETPEMFVQDAENQGIEYQETIEWKAENDLYQAIKDHPTCQL